MYTTFNIHSKALSSKSMLPRRLVLFMTVCFYYILVLTLLSEILNNDIMCLMYSEKEMHALVIKLCESESFAAPVYVLDLNRHLLACLEEGMICSV